MLTFPRKSPDLYLLQASEEARVCVSVLRVERGDDGVWDALMEKATSDAEVYEIQPCITRTTPRQEHRRG